ncbi:MAG TPA: HAD-IA family hydrolase [Burkholderiales bacterium]|jgi:phosphoglycolate phosphatase|nr:HAD-IA family hydrolase [Burkholderiales bacterium]
MSSRAVLFDLDGTFADTAPDLAAALNRLRAEQGLEALPLERVRPFASAGARGLIHAGFGIKPGDNEYASLREAFLEFYAERTCVKTRLFPGVAELLETLEKRSLPWGLVTNKATRFTDRILAALDLRPDCVVCGDTTPHLKPHPAPLLHAAEQLGLPPQVCAYLGDDLRDIQAARAAGMRSIAVDWGYHHPEQGGPGTWQADAVIAHPRQLLELL